MTADYSLLIDAETWAFIERTNSFYPPDAVDFSVAQQRRVYDEMCRAFFAGYPASVTSRDDTFDTAAGPVGIRHYRKGGGEAEAFCLYFHGGGFVVGGLDSHDDVCAEICDATGFDVVSVDYRLAPEHLHPASFDDALAAFHHLAGMTELPIVLCGDSAGGNLAAAVTHHVRGGPRQPAGQVLVYPGLGGNMEQGSYVEHGNAPMLTTRDTIYYADLRGGGRDWSADPRFAPLADTDFSALPPTVVISAECDPLSDDGRHYRDRIVQAGGMALWNNEPGLVHGYLRARHSVDRARRSFRRILTAIHLLGQDRWPGSL
ncbi:alpha/beta hydrolase [Phyllobacterium sp. 21LDTY02-6]|uniref:alpha/beta hydrolase n=1 Tax=Phyllobacterium sp. 21LDTY02-6 TaxID=2944903 RepID=UPI0020223BE5|nr:alpha/beta hydrolase [Phyllobacterium sp. 21LDTY02-6]MCO4316445.1 alpha/beta hydrolase [Phyllobacterium sp. 21LDTY02-6]